MLLKKIESMEEVGVGEEFLKNVAANPSLDSHIRLVTADSELLKQNCGRDISEGKKKLCRF